MQIKVTLLDAHLLVNVKIAPTHCLECRRGQLRLSAAEMQLLGESRASLRLVIQLAKQDNPIAARAQLQEVSEHNSVVSISNMPPLYDDQSVGCLHACHMSKIPGDDSNLPTASCMSSVKSSIFRSFMHFAVYQMRTCVSADAGHP